MVTNMQWSIPLLQQKLKSINANKQVHFIDKSMTWDQIVVHPEYKAAINEIVEEGNRLLARAIPDLTEELYQLFEQTGNRLSYEQAYFERRRRLTSFTLLSLLYPQHRQYTEALVDIIEAILEESTWCLPAHMAGNPIATHIDLFSAETAFTYAELIHLLKEVLPSGLVERMIEHINRRVIEPYLHHGPYHWEDANHNWASVCAGSIGSAALLLEMDIERKATIISKALTSMEHYLSGFGEDGACLEGVGYWNYGFGYFIYFADLLYQASDGQLNLLSSNKVKQIALFQQRFYLIENRSPNFSDAEPYINIQIGLSDYLANYFDEAEYAAVHIRSSYIDDHCSRFAPAIRNLTWYKPNIARSAQWQQGSYIFEDAQVLVSRVERNQHQFGFAAKGGHNEEPHNHIDVGHFILLANQEPAFASDLGSGEYTADYFSDKRYQYDCTGAQGHSLPIIGGCLQQQGQQASASLIRNYLSDEKDEFVLDLTDCYEHQALLSFVRRLEWNKGSMPSLTLTDEMHFFENATQADMTTAEIFITKCEPHVLEDGTIRLQGNQLSVHLKFNPIHYTTSIELCHYNNHHGQQESYYRIKIESYALTVHQFEFQFITT